jgi:hypothetical protein
MQITFVRVADHPDGILNHPANDGGLVGLIHCWFLGVINHQYLDGAIGRFQSEPQLLL